MGSEANKTLQQLLSEFDEFVERTLQRIKKEYQPKNESSSVLLYDSILGNRYVVFMFVNLSKILINTYIVARKTFSFDFFVTLIN